MTKGWYFWVKWSCSHQITWVGLWFGPIHITNSTNIIYNKCRTWFCHWFWFEVYFNPIINNGKIFGCGWKVEKKANRNIIWWPPLEFESLGPKWYKYCEIRCGECCKEFGGISGDHSKSSINNPFGIFKKNHIMSFVHVQN